MQVNSVGFYKEMSDVKGDAESIHSYVNKGRKEEIENICNYLDSGIAIVVVPGISKDIINPERGSAGTSSKYTDGVWIWRGDLSYYVRRYNLKLPENFIKTMKNNKWKVPITIEDLDSDSLEIDGIKIY